MVKSYILVVTELDVAEDAMIEAKEKLAAIPLLKNTIGIVTIHSDFLVNDIYAQVVRSLPFTVAGTTTSSQSVNGTVGPYLLSILILTSDDCHFSCGCSDILPIEGDTGQITRECYLSLRSRLEGQCKLVLLYVPCSEGYYPSQYIDALSQIDPVVPVFGMVANDSPDAEIANNMPRTLLGEHAYDNRLVMLLVDGDISPEFYISSLTDEVVAMPHVGMITAAERNRILEINDMNVLEFFDKLGFKIGEAGISAMATTTFILDIPDGADDSGVVISRTPVLIADKSVYCAGQVYTGGILSIAFSTPTAVVETATEIAMKIKESGKKTALLYSCQGRSFCLLSEPKKEMERIDSIVSEDCRYLVAYASGEICPAQVTPEKVYNHEHNQTLVACVF